MGLVLVSSVCTLVAGQAVPAWCQYVPVSFQGAACRGSSSGCSCQSFCNDKKDANNPECCGCVDTAEGAQQSASPTPASQMYMLRGSPTNQGQENRSHTEGNVLAAVAAQSVPSWCQYVPVSFQGAACRG